MSPLELNGVGIFFFFLLKTHLTLAAQNSVFGITYGKRKNQAGLAGSLTKHRAPAD